MNSNLTEITKEIKKIEEKAEKDYSEIINNLSDVEIVKKISAIRDDEKEHIKLCDKIIGIINS